MPIEDFYKKLNDDNYCQVSPNCLKVNQFIRYYNEEKNTLPFCVIKEIYKNKLKVQAYKAPRNWFISFDKVKLFYTPKNIEKRFLETKKK